MGEYIFLYGAIYCLIGFLCVQWARAKRNLDMQVSEKFVGSDIPDPGYHRFT